MNILFFFTAAILISCSLSENNEDALAMDTISLPQPQLTGEISIEETLSKRRSVREYTDSPLSISEVAQLAWAAQGVNDERSGFRTAPSAGATFPIEIYLFVTDIEDVSNGVYRYNYDTHTLEKKIDGDKRRALYDVTLRQPSIADAPVVMVITGVVERTAQRYGDRALRYVYMEAGHVAQNVYLQGVALDIGTVVIGAFDDAGVSDVLQLQDGEHPLYIMSLGKI